MLTPRERKSGLLLLCLIIVKGVGDMIGVATIMPFLSLLGNPDLVKTNPIANYFYVLFDFRTVDSFITMVGVAFVCMLIAVGILRSVTAYALNRWISMREYSLSLRLLSVYLRQPYEFFLNRHTGQLGTYILNESAQVVANAFRPATEIINSLMTFFLIASFLLWAEPTTTIISVLAFGGCYFLLYYSLKAMISRMGDDVLQANQARFKIVVEAFNGVKQIKLLGREQSYVAEFANAAARQAKIRALSLTLRQVPKFGLEALAFGGIIILTLVLVARNGGPGSETVADILPILGLYAFAGYRMLPTMQTMYSSISSLRFGEAAVNAIYDDLNLPTESTDFPKSHVTPLGLTKSVNFISLNYQYPGSDEGGLKDLTFGIDRGQTVGVVGTTGAGKTTLVDVFLGLLPATDGRIVIDDKDLTPSRVRQWQASVGYVPQEVFLVDASVSENIALGIPKDEIDNEAVRKAATSAQLLEFIETQMPEGFDTHVGERGVRISGGQRQRIGIARALYHNPEILVFDEATSALDNATERELMKEINALSGDKTIIMIAHRISTLKDCDYVLVLEKGRLARKVTYDELLADNTFSEELTS